MQIKCHLCACRFETEQDSGEVRCPRCEAKVTVAPDRAARETQVLGCPGCLKQLRTADAPPVRCRYCGTDIDEEAGKKLAGLLEGLEERTRVSLMAGEPPAELVRNLADQGVEQDRAFAFVDRLVLEVPFDRHQLWKKGSAQPSAPPTCDACGIAGKLNPWEAHWTLNPEEMQRYRPEWGGFTGEFGKLQNYDKWALYYLCESCRKARINDFAGGYPARTGYIRKHFKRAKV